MEHESAEQRIIRRKSSTFLSTSRVVNSTSQADYKHVNVTSSCIVLKHENTSCTFVHKNCDVRMKIGRKQIENYKFDTERIYPKRKAEQTE